MRRMRNTFDKVHWIHPRGLAVALLLAGCPSMLVRAQQPGQRTFTSPEQASAALVAAAQASDEKALLDILGADGRQIISSGDDAEDAQSRANFVQRYQEMHRLVKEPDASTTLYIGAENWPTPIPLVSKGPSWFFDTAMGKREILCRRIGQNELSTIGVCQELVKAQQEYFTSQYREYAQTLFSEGGQHNGLYWQAAAGEPLSPIGPLVAAAVAKGYARTQNGTPTPYCGYFFRILTAQGKAAPGGAKSYILKGRMTEGFAFVAYPAEYRSSGVMTFLVNQDGVVHQKDLGPKTGAIASMMRDYNPSAGWALAQAAEDEPVEPAMDRAGQR